MSIKETWCKTRLSSFEDCIPGSISRSSSEEYQLHIKKVLGFKYWDKRRQKPKP